MYKGLAAIRQECKERYVQGERGHPPAVQLTRLGVMQEQYVPVPRHADQMRAIIAKAEKEHRLSLHWQHLSSIPSGVLELDGLVELRLTNNFLTELPKEIKRLRSLQVLWLSNNLLTTVPDQLSQLKLLQQLSLEDNQIVSLPGKMVRLKALEVCGVSKVVEVLTR